MNKSLGLIFFALLVQGCLAQIYIEGKCPQIKVIKDMKFSEFAGEWFGYAKYDFEVNSNLKCNKAIYTDHGAQNIQVENIGVTKDNNEKFSVHWPARIIDSGKLAVFYDDKQCLGYPNFHILGTDYKNYAAVFNCKQISESITEQTAWLLTRKQIPKQETVNAAKKIFVDNHVDIKYLIQNDQTTCNTKKAGFSLFGFLG